MKFMTLKQSSHLSMIRNMYQIYEESHTKNRIIGEYKFIEPTEITYERKN